MPKQSQPVAFRQRLLARDVLLGTFVKFPTGHTTEMLGGLGFDFVVIDEEHGPFDRVATDQALMGARAGGIAGLVRVPDMGRILGALDDGATGVLVPHVSTPEKAREAVALCRYRGGVRGFSNTTRAGGYGARGIWEHVDAQDAAVTVVAMIEDPEALRHLDAILATDGLDAAFIGRGDLTVALGAGSLAAPETQAATETILAAARKAGKPVCIMVAGAAEAAEWRTLGASAFIVSSDQGFLRQAALRTADDFAPMKQ
jgi:staphyloferrin B biosynthesis citrate synthase